MKKLLFLLQITLGLSIVFSCVSPYDNVEPSIEGPRILSRIDSIQDTRENYLSSNGKLLTVINNFDSYVVTINNNTAGKIATFEYKETIDGKVSLKKINLSYTNTVFTSGTIDEYVDNVQKFHNLLTVNYDALGKVTQIYQKIGTITAGPVPVISYATFTQDNMSYIGKNINIVETKQGTLDLMTGVILTSSTVFKNIFENYDAKKSPYSTLPNEYNLCFGIVRLQDYGRASANNYTIYRYSVAGANLFEKEFTYKYDAQDYPKSDETGTIKYLYKAVK